MTTPDSDSVLYWHGGLFRVSIDFRQIAVSREVERDAISVLDEFRSLCQRHYFAYIYTLFGLQIEHEKYKEIYDPVYKDNIIGIGSSFPDAEQRPGKSVIGEMRQGELLECLQAGGEFENLIARAFIVFVYQSWDEVFRQRIANTLSITKTNIMCDLMGDLRHIRHIIVHKASIIPEGFSNSLTLLPEIWRLPPGNLNISQEMMHSLMEQLNALHLTISPPEESR